MGNGLKKEETLRVTKRTLRTLEPEVTKSSFAKTDTIEVVSKRTRLKRHRGKPVTRRTAAPKTVAKQQDERSTANVSRRLSLKTVVVSAECYHEAQGICVASSLGDVFFILYKHLDAFCSFISEQNFPLHGTMVYASQESVMEKLVLLSKGFFYFVSNKREPELVLVFELNGNRTKKIPENVGRLIFAKNFVHKEDPVFSESDDINLHAPPDTAALFRVDNKVYEVSNHAFEQFLSRYRHRDAQKDKTAKVEAAGFCLMRLFTIFKRSRPAVRKNALKQIIRHGFKVANYRITTDHWIFVIEKNRIVTVYNKGCTADLYTLKP